MAKTKPNKLKYIKEYDRSKRVQIVLKLNKDTDSDVIEILNNVTSKQGFIKALIRAAYEEKDDTYSNISTVFHKYELGSYYNDRSKKS